ncbi:MAG: S8 family peptidase [Deltaproteobacteria bacterium]|nr:S8 family peptidase [Deltaproteobacteria bacterium]
MRESPRRRHIHIRERAERERYQPHPQAIEPPLPPPRPANPKAHASRLIRALNAAVEEARRSALPIAEPIPGTKPGVRILFESPPGVELNLGSLENQRSGIELLAVTESERDGRKVQMAAVFVPYGAVKTFLSRLDKYMSEKSRSGEARHRDMVDRIAAIRRATIRALWTDDPEDFPEPGRGTWWEVWLRRHLGGEAERLVAFAASQPGMLVASRRLVFDDRTVTLIFATPEQLTSSLDVLDSIAELRRPNASLGAFADLDPHEQAVAAKELVDRTSGPPDEPDGPAVCVLDTGINRLHPLLDRALAEDDTHACDSSWGKADHDGHGTEMGGLALYGDLGPVLASAAPVTLRHRLESVKILPPPGKPENRPELYGAITAEASSLVEIQAPDRRRCFSSAVTDGTCRHRGRPTSWSAAIDSLAAGRSFDADTRGLVYLNDAEQTAHRLFLLSAGDLQVKESSRDHLADSDTTAVHDPAQAWNALTVGACTELIGVADPGGLGDGWHGLAPGGELSPYSTTSLTFQDAWPLKPDVVFEGGNLACSPSGKQVAPGVPSLSVLTTNWQPAKRLFVESWATSAAVAQVARIGGLILADYPDFWPETIRALIVHSARWTPAMRAQFDPASKTDRRRLLRRYGYGVPDATRALWSASNTATLVVQDTIRPFAEGKMGEMTLHRLPWPTDVLRSLGELPVTLRVTLSYFVEPNPARCGWKKRHDYASHGLRFAVIRPTEKEDTFRKRVNRVALDDDEKKPKGGTASDVWFLGSRTREKGSLHSDTWSGTAAELAARNAIAVFPVSGWWKEQPKRDRSKFGARYALVVSIETDKVDVDVWTPIANLVGIPVNEVEVG